MARQEEGGFAQPEVRPGDMARPFRFGVFRWGSGTFGDLGPSVSWVMRLPPMFLLPRQSSGTFSQSRDDMCTAAPEHVNQ